MTTIEDTVGIDNIQETIEDVAAEHLAFIPQEHVLDLDLLEGGRYEVSMNYVDSLQILVDENLTTGFQWIVYMKQRGY